MVAALALAAVGWPLPAQIANDDPIVMKPFVVATPCIDVRLFWFKDRKKVERTLFVQVAKVVPDSAAFKAGVREHMVIHAFNGKTVNDLTRPEIMKVLDGPLDKKGNFVLTVLSGLETRKIAVPGTKTLEERKEKSLAPK